ncbi:MAG: carboxylating nicotinate-nucleotide diphosphorylase [Actinomycetota bacterium]
MDIRGDARELIRRAVTEDLGGGGDVTSRAIVVPDAACRGAVLVKADGVIAGTAIFSGVFAELDRAISVEWSVADGDAVGAGAEIGTVIGPARPVLAGERVALNFLQHLSGVATLTRRYVDACEGTGSVVLCTRKTLPGLRSLERQAVESGGGMLHRAGLDDGVLIKDNHVRLAGGVTAAVKRAKAGAPPSMDVEVEVESIEELEEAIKAGTGAVLLDNPDLETVKRAVDVVAGRVPLEVSGGITLDRIREIAAAGRLRISVGRITHSAPALDVSLELRTA